MAPEKSEISGLPADPGRPALALWIGPGGLFRELRAVLEVLARSASGAPAAIEALDDLDRLLEPPPPSGRLLLEAEALPGEDVGLVRRFLRRHPGWTLVLCGGDPRHSTVRSLSLEGRARWLAWPPDLDQMRALVASNGRVEGAAAPSTPSPPSSSPRAAPAPAGAAFDVGEMLEEFLASAALEEAPPRYSYSSRGDLLVALPPDDVSLVIEAVLAVAAAAGGEGSEVAVGAARSDAGAGSSVLFTIAFPEGPLAGVGTKRVLEPGILAARIGEGLAAELETASARLAALGGSAEAARPEEGRLELRLTLPAGA